MTTKTDLPADVRWTTQALLLMFEGTRPNLTPPEHFGRYTALICEEMGQALTTFAATHGPDQVGAEMRRLWAAVRDDPRLAELRTAVDAAEVRALAERNGHPPDERPTPLSDQYNAEALVRAHGADLRYCHPLETWLVWSTTHWQHDRTGEVMRRAKQTVMSFANALPQLSGDELKAMLGHFKSSLSASRLEGLVKLARSEPGIPVLPEDLDRDPWVLNVTNGTLDLRTGELRQPHRREDLLTRCLPMAYDPRASCARWCQFLHDIMAGNTAMIDYLQRAVGYSLTGSVQEQCFFFCYGSGQNGKSTFLNVLLTLFAAYGMQAMPELLMVRQHEAHPTERADLYQKRLVVAVEVTEGGRLNEALVKLLTGGERIRARHMRQDFFEFEPTHKSWLAGNHRPVIRGTDDAIWRRPRLIPFTVKIAEAQKDTTLLDKLKQELPGILRWAVEGALAWQEHGLQDPPEVLAAGEAYRAEMDTLGQFLAECCTVQPARPEVRTQSRVLYEAFCAYAGDGLTQTMFSLRLKDRGFTTKGSHGRAYWQGIGLMTSRDDERRDD
jgi:putative DNA primase/helicase